MTGSQECQGRTEGSAPCFRLQTIKKRLHFKAANGGTRFSCPGFTMLRAAEAATPGLRFGFTVTRRLGKAVLRNRIRRRLRAAVQAALAEQAFAEQALAGQAFAGQAMDLVILARGAAADLPFATLRADIARAMQRLARREAQKEGPPSSIAKRVLGKGAPLA